jgi:hypothetical protein
MVATWRTNERATPHTIIDISHAQGSQSPNRKTSIKTDRSARFVAAQPGPLGHLNLKP